MVDVDTLQKAKQQQQQEGKITKIKPPLASKEGQAVKNPKMRFYDHHNDHKINAEDYNDRQNINNNKKQTDFVLQCRCFYCRGRSNCLFVNSIEGYHECGQYTSKDFGDEGNKEQQHFRNTDNNNKNNNQRDDAQTQNENDQQQQQKHRCTLMTDSWYLGQILYFLATEGDLLFPTAYSMKEVIEMMENGLKKAADVATAAEQRALSLDEIFPHLSSSSVMVKNKKKKSKNSRNSNDDDDDAIRDRFVNGVVKQLLVDRLTPRGAAELLLKLQCGGGENFCSSFTRESWCPMEYNVQSRTMVAMNDSEFLKGLKVAV